MADQLANQQPETDFTVGDAPQIVWVPAQSAYRMLWKDNHKRHDLGALIQSLQRYGMQELPKYDATLQAIKAGNGRIHAVAMMERDGNYEPPRGVGTREDGTWVVPLLVGVDAESRELAEAYALDSNNLTLAGGDFTDYDMMNLWDEDGYKEVLRRLADADTFAVTVSSDSVDDLLKEFNAELDIDYGSAENEQEPERFASEDAVAEADGEKEEDAFEGLESSGIKQVQLFFTGAQHEQFMKHIEGLKAEFEFPSITDAVFKVVEDAYDAL